MHRIAFHGTPARSAPPASDGVDERLEQAVDRVLRVPDRYREFRHDERRARREHSIPGELLERLSDLGLPSRRADGVPHYDRLDLANVALSLRLSNARSMMMRGWANVLRGTADAPASAFEVDVEARCPDPGDHEDCAYELSDALRGLEGFAPGADERTGLLSRRIARPEPVDSAHPRALAELVRPLHYHLLPEELRADLGFLDETGLAECALAAAFLVREAGAMGIEARYSHGLFLAVPYSMIHTWTDVRDDGAWTAIDPHLVNLLIGWSLLDPMEWPLHRTIGGCVVRVADHDVKLITDRGAGAVLSLATRCGAEEVA